MPFPTHTSPLEQSEKKRKRKKKGKEASKEVEIPSKDLEPQKGAKLLKGRKKGIHLRTQAQTWSLIVVLWNPTLELDGPPLPLDSSIRDFQKGNVGYVADALE